MDSWEGLSHEKRVENFRSIMNSYFENMDDSCTTCSKTNLSDLPGLFLSCHKRLQRMRRATHFHVGMYFGKDKPPRSLYYIYSILVHRYFPNEYPQSCKIYKEYNDMKKLREVTSTSCDNQRCLNPKHIEISGFKALSMKKKVKEKIINRKRKREEKSKEENITISNSKRKKKKMTRNMFENLVSEVKRIKDEWKDIKDFINEFDLHSEEEEEEEEEEEPPPKKRKFKK